jgi:energy-converting hydrogenase Eha subunit E
MVVLPGLGATMATFRPGEAGIPTQLATIFGAGYATVGLSSTFLALLHVLSPVTFLVTLSGITVALWFAGLSRGAPRARLHSLRGEIRATPWTVGLGLAFLVALSLVLLFGYSPLVNFGASNPFRYWADGLEIATAGGVPESTLQWGTEYPPTVSKLVFNAFNAALSYVTPGALAAMGAATLLGLVALPAAGWAVGREIGFRYAAPLVAVLFGTRVFLGHVMAFNPTLFVGETFGLMTATCALALGLHALRHADRWAVAILAGVVFAVAAGSHLVPAFIMLALFGWYALGRLLTHRDLRHVAGTALVVFALAGAIAAANLLLSGGDIGFGGTEGSDRYETSGGRFDPTAFFTKGEARQDPIDQPATRIEANRGWYDPPITVFSDYVRKSLGPTPTTLLLYLAPLLLGLGGMAVLWRWPRRLKPVGLAAVGFWSTILVLGVLFSLWYDTYIPARFPNRRLFSYGAVAFILLGLAAIEMLLLRLRRLRSWAPVAAAALLMGIGAMLVVPSAGVPEEEIAKGSQSLSAMNAIRAEVPCDARILASRRTAGIFQAITGRVAITEGITPFVRPGMLTDIIERLIEARRFLRFPTPHRDFLVRQAVDYVIVVKKKYVLDVYPQLMGPADSQALARADFLELVHRSSLMDIYRVTGLPEGPDFPDPGEFAGYSCGRGPVASA